jgi:hypothetical protein
VPVALSATLIVMGLIVMFLPGMLVCCRHMIVSGNHSRHFKGGVLGDHQPEGQEESSGDFVEGPHRRID